MESLPLFSAVDGAGLSRLLQFSTIQGYPSGTLLFEEGGQPDTLHVVIGGAVEIFSNGNGREWCVMLMSSGDAFLPAAVLFNEPYVVSARTLRPSSLLLIDGESVRNEALNCAKLAIQLARVMAGQLRIAVRQVIELKSRSAAQRLGSFLLKLADTSSARIPELPMRKRNLAARVGMTPETLSRTLQTLADNGLVVRGRQVIVRDRERIERFCGPDPCRPPVADSIEVNTP